MNLTFFPRFWRSSSVAHTTGEIIPVIGPNVGNLVDRAGVRTMIPSTEGVGRAIGRNTPAAIARPELIDEIGSRFGAQAVIVAIDARRAKSTDDPVTNAEVFVSGGRKAAGRKVLDWAKEAESRGAGEILLTSMDADGTRAGCDRAR